MTDPQKTDAQLKGATTLVTHMNKTSKTTRAVFIMTEPIRRNKTVIQNIWNNINNTNTTNQVNKNSSSRKQKCTDCMRSM